MTNSVSKVFLASNQSNGIPRSWKVLAAAIPLAPSPMMQAVRSFGCAAAVQGDFFRASGRQAAPAGSPSERGTLNLQEPNRSLESSDDRGSLVSLDTRQESFDIAQRHQHPIRKRPVVVGTTIL
jgi:hypothetical protein